MDMKVAYISIVMGSEVLEWGILKNNKERVVPNTPINNFSVPLHSVLNI